MNGGNLVLIVVAASLIGVILLSLLAVKIYDFNKKRKYLNRELARAEGSERSYWKHKKRKLWQTWNPFRRR